MSEQGETHPAYVHPVDEPQENPTDDELEAAPEAGHQAAPGEVKPDQESLERENLAGDHTVVPTPEPTEGR